MRTRIVLAGAVLACLPLGAADPPGVVIWPATELKGYAKSLAPKVNDKKLASEPLGKFGNHSFLIGHREGDGEAEVHDGQADVFFVQTGAATLVLGGEVVDGKSTAPGETRAPSIKGGSRREIAAGDVVHIPAKVPHWLLVAKGKEFTYFVVKIDTP